MKIEGEGKCLFSRKCSRENVVEVTDCLEKNADQELSQETV